MNTATRRAERHASPLPGNRFRDRRINVLKRAATLSWPGPDARNDLSLACNSCGFHRLHSRVNVPGLLLRFLPIDSAARSIFRSITDPRFASAIRQPQRFRPVAASSICSACRFSGLHFPSGHLHPSGSKRSAGLAASQPAFRIRPISVRSPLPVSITSCGCGSTFPVRYAFGGLLFQIGRAHV